MTELRNARRPSVDEEMAKLKDFQRDTVRHVHRRLWLDEDSNGRFLVADEVGLGKTLVARGVIGHAIDHLWDLPRGKRIDIVYICSNQQIARQNLRRLNVADYDIVSAGRLSMLPLVVGEMRNSRVNILSLTPGTSMDVASGPGTVRERALLHHLMALGTGNQAMLEQQGWSRFFRGRVAAKNYPWVRDHEINAGAIDVDFAKEFVRRLHQEPYTPPFSAQAATLEPTDVFDAAASLARRLANAKLETTYGVPERWRHVWWYLIGRLRHVVARSAVALLDPDLVILDEFQRFRKYLQPVSDESGSDRDAIELAQTIFEHQGKDGPVRVLLLSATPFAMYSHAGGSRDESHEGDFHLTTTFLSDPVMARSIRERQRTVRDAALGHGDVAAASALARSVEADLRRVMCRTERLAKSDDRNGMLRTAALPPVIPQVSDIRALGGVTRLGTVVGARHSLFEYWRSAPYLVSLMDKYQFKHRVRGSLESPTPALIEALSEEGAQVPWAQMSDYEQIDLGNAKLRILWKDLADRRAADVPWLPAALPYYEHGGAFAEAAATGLTKRLVFSSWAVAPRAISTLLSYQAEQVSAGADDEFRKEHRSPLPWARDPGGRLASMPLLSLVYPSFLLAKLGDPREVAAALGQVPAPLEQVLAVVAERIEGELSMLPAGPPDGRVDERWYWAAPFALDRRADPERFARHLESESGWLDNDDAESLYALHLGEALQVDEEWLGQLGRRPTDLVDLLTQLAVAGPATCALRALGRAVPGPPLTDERLRGAAQAIGLAFRTLVSSREISRVVARLAPAGVYHRAVLSTCVIGNLQAVFDEYVHVLTESQGLQSKGDDERIEALGSVVKVAMAQRAGAPKVDQYEMHGDQLTASTVSLRTHFAARYGREESTDKAVQTETHIRDAFNSPFWPFVLASTSVGQEGLDFHTYCHAVVHWNLPSNPVDLEQREGRVHRYKGHAVRKNVAADFPLHALDLSCPDPWTSVFDAARSAAAALGQDEITPYWVYPREGGASIERYVPANPLSQETARLDSLLRSVTRYRLTIGQPRQEDLLAYVGEPETFGWMAMDLSPPRAPE